MARYILAIDPGNIESAFVIMDTETLRPLHIGKMENEAIIKHVHSLLMLLFTIAMTNNDQFHCDLVIEMIASYGMPVGAEVFDTAVWIGDFRREALRSNLITNITSETFEAKKYYVYRREEKLTLCGSPKANDANIRQALVDRFARGETNSGKGTKKKPGWFYGFHSDIWQAYAVGVTYAERERRNE